MYQCMDHTDVNVKRIRPVYGWYRYECELYQCTKDTDVNVKCINVRKIQIWMWTISMYERYKCECEVYQRKLRGQPGKDHCLVCSHCWQQATLSCKKYVYNTTYKKQSVVLEEVFWTFCSFIWANHCTHCRQQAVMPYKKYFYNT